MSHIRVQINDVVEYDGELSEYVKRPPDMVRDMLRPGAAVAPWLKAVALVLTDAVLKNEPADIRVRHDEAGWLLGVKHK